MRSHARFGVFCSRRRASPTCPRSFRSLPPTTKVLLPAPFIARWTRAPSYAVSLSRAATGKSHWRQRCPACRSSRTESGKQSGSHSNHVKGFAKSESSLRAPELPESFHCLYRSRAREFSNLRGVARQRLKLLVDLIRDVDDPVWNEVRLDVGGVPMRLGQRFVCSDELDPGSLTDRPSCNHHAVEDQSMIDVAIRVTAQNNFQLHLANDGRDSLVQNVNG